MEALSTALARRFRRKRENSLDPDSVLNAVFEPFGKPLHFFSVFSEDRSTVAEIAVTSFGSCVAMRRAASNMPRDLAHANILCQ